MERTAAVFFRDQFRDARAKVLANSEDFDGVVQTLERLGRFISSGDGNGLGSLVGPLQDLAQMSPLACSVPLRQPNYHMTISTLLESVRVGRNMAIHEGALARRLAAHSVECALTFEDALEGKMKEIGEFMVRSPVEAASWHPLSFVRQAMLTGSYSYLPVRYPEGEAGTWKLISDVSLARALRSSDHQVRAHRLSMSLGDAVSQQLVKLDTPELVPIGAEVEAIASTLRSLPILVVGKDPRELIGIVTAFDLL